MLSLGLQFNGFQNIVRDPSQKRKKKKTKQQEQEQTKEQLLGFVKRVTKEFFFQILLFQITIIILMACKVSKPCKGYTALLAVGKLEQKTAINLRSVWDTGKSLPQINK